MLVGLEIGPVVSEKKIREWGILVRLSLMSQNTVFNSLTTMLAPLI